MGFQYLVSIQCQRTPDGHQCKHIGSFKARLSAPKCKWRLYRHKVSYIQRWAEQSCSSHSTVCVQRYWDARCATFLPSFGCSERVRLDWNDDYQFHGTREKPTSQYIVFEWERPSSCIVNVPCVCFMCRQLHLYSIDHSLTTLYDQTYIRTRNHSYQNRNRHPISATHLSSSFFSLQTIATNSCRRQSWITNRWLKILVWIYLSCQTCHTSNWDEPNFPFTNLK